MPIPSFRMPRRAFLGGAAAAGALPFLPRPAFAQDAPIELRAAPKDIALMEDAPASPLWTYGGAVPGQTLRVKQGERLRVRLQNDLPQPTTVHWHGIRIDNAMDGVAGVTQEPIPPGEFFDYDFLVPDAGTYWYHPHFRSWEQLARGLYGVLIVEEAEPPQVDRDLTLVVDDWLLTDDGAFDADSLGMFGHWTHGGRTGNWPTVNGVYRPDIPIRRGERLRLRLINTANASIMPLALTGFTGAMVAVDGQPLPAPEPLPEVVALGPGQRVDVIVDADKDAALSYVIEGQEPYPFASFTAEGVLRDAPLGEIAPLPVNPLPETLDLDDALRVDLPMAGGAMGGLAEARLGAHPMTAMMGRESGGGASSVKPLPIRDLVQRGFVWSLAGVAGMPLDPLFTVKQGRTVVISMPNETAWPHAMHLHGHHFRQVGPASAPWRDTILVERRETVEIAFKADNLGDWMLHCHMLEHQVSGMATWFRVV